MLFATKALLSSLFVFKRVFVCTRPLTYCTCETEIALCRGGRGLAGGGDGSGGGSGSGGGLLLGDASLSPRSCRSRGRVYFLAVLGVLELEVNGAAAAISLLSCSVRLETGLQRILARCFSVRLLLCLRLNIKRCYHQC